jgi:uncharacterized DUF497 family protein
MSFEFSFSWDPRKAASNGRKHGVQFPEAMTVFLDPEQLSLYDQQHSVVVVCHTLREDELTDV